MFFENQDISTYNILGVETNNIITTALERTLSLPSCKYTSCKSISSVPDYLANNTFDILIINMGEVDSANISLLKQIRIIDEQLYIILVIDDENYYDSIKPYVQSYCTVQEIFHQLPLLVDSATKSIDQVRTIKAINQELVESKEKLERAYLQSIETLRFSVEAKDEYTRGHSDRVSEYSVLIGKRLGLPNSEIENLRLGGLLHDIGKIGISDSILTKNGKLTDEEYAEIKKHPVIGKNILSNAEIFQDILPIVLYHHERVDGKGYPYGLRDKDIPFLARIVSVADAFDAMTSKRSYRDELPIPFVKEELKSKTGTQFDPVVSMAFLDVLNNDYRLIEEIKRKCNK